MVAFNRKKGQAAMEFLMTYGWAILVVLVVIGALAYFGVLSPSTLLPEKCTFPVSLSCTDHSVSGTAITLILQNGAGRDMTITRISAASEALGGGANPANLGCACGTGAISTTFRNGGSATFILSTPDAGCATYCQFRDTGRDKNRYNITLTYSWLDSPTITHQLSGELLARRT
ncbi:hypothetical protein HYU40_03680 [Candidatus Woesearchaeota archaeon]|nr:hypothetical protein [Candidatus Woesearchaeota archaeon]